MKKYWINYTLACIMVASLAACQSAPSCAAWSDQKTDPQFSKFAVIDDALAERVGAVSVSSLVNGAGNAVVEAVLRNCTGSPLVLTVRTQFEGGSARLANASAWKTVQLPPRSTAIYNEFSVQPSERLLRVEVQR